MPLGVTAPPSHELGRGCPSAHKPERKKNLTDGNTSYYHGKYSNSAVLGHRIGTPLKVPSALTPRPSPPKPRRASVAKMYSLWFCAEMQKKNQDKKNTVNSRKFHRL